MPLNHIENTQGWCNRFANPQEKNNHLMYMDNIKLLAKNENELETLIQTIRLYSQDIGMEYIYTNNEKWKKINNGRNRTAKLRKNKNNWRKESLKVLSNIGSEHHQTRRDERKNEKKYIRRTRKLFKIKLYKRNLEA